MKSVNQVFDADIEGGGEHPVELAQPHPPTSYDSSRAGVHPGNGTTAPSARGYFQSVSEKSMKACQS